MKLFTKDGITVQSLSPAEDDRWKRLGSREVEQTAEEPEKPQEPKPAPKPAAKADSK